MKLILLYLLLVGSPIVISETVVGFAAGNRFIVIEENSADVDRELCVVLYSTDQPPGQTFNINVVYQSRTAQVNLDFDGIPMSVILSSTTQESCFIFNLIDDNEYEVREEFFLNLTTSDPAITIMPNHRIIMIEDDDSLLISWERQEYTVREEEGSLEVCARIVGTHATTISLSNILLVEGTATEGVDYMRLRDILNFEVGGPTTICYTINLIIDIAYEGTKEFMAHILAIENERIQVLPFARIVLLDYNVIVQQQPRSVCEGLQNLFNTTIPTAFTCNVFECEGVQCQDSGGSIALTTSPCTRSISVSAMDKNGRVLFSEELESLPQPQGQLNVSIQVVTNPGYSGEYYIVSLNSTGLQLPSTAIPLSCQPATEPPITASQEITNGQGVTTNGQSVSPGGSPGVTDDQGGVGPGVTNDQGAAVTDTGVTDDQHGVSPGGSTDDQGAGMGQRSSSGTLTPSIICIMMITVLH